MTTDKSPEQIILQTEKWIRSVVVGLNFCPFAAKELKQNSISYEVYETTSKQKILEGLSAVLTKMDEDEKVATALCILPQGFSDFKIYLDLVNLAEDFLIAEDYESVYQIASFHPLYCFADAAADDPANFTNRSPYPMLHILRESAITAALKNFKNADSIPGNNIKKARELGLVQMQALRNACFHLP